MDSSAVLTRRRFDTGHRLVIAIIIFVLAISELAILLPVLRGAAPQLTSVGRFILTAGLCWALYLGKVWARNVSIVLLVLAGIVSFIAGVSFIKVISAPTIGVLSLALALSYFASVYVLLFVPHVQLFFGKPTKQVGV